MEQGARKVYSLDEVLTVSTGCLVAERGVEVLYDLMGHLTGDPGITTLGYAAAAGACKRELLKQFPILEQVEDPEFGENATKDDVRGWVKQQEKNLGATTFAVLGDTVHTRDYSFMDDFGSARKS